MNDGPNWQKKHELDFAKGREIYCKTWGGEEGDEHGEDEVKALIEELAIDDWEPHKAWEQRPISKVLIEYAVGDVVILPILYSHFAFHKRFTSERRQAVDEETANRIRGSQADVLQLYDPPNGAPSGWDSPDWCKSPRIEE